MRNFPTPWHPRSFINITSKRVPHSANHSPRRLRLLAGQSERPEKDAIPRKISRPRPPCSRSCVHRAGAALRAVRLCVLLRVVTRPARTGRACLLVRSGLPLRPPAVHSFTQRSEKFETHSRNAATPRPAAAVHSFTQRSAKFEIHSHDSGHTFCKTSPTILNKRSVVARVLTHGTGADTACE